MTPPAPNLTAVVADDEQLARDELCFLLTQLGTVEIVGKASNGMEALDEIARHAPDVAFLDVQMPGLTGFEVARRLLAQGTGPGVIFVTAYDQRAIEAFEVNAVDYLLKPVNGQRLETAIDRIRDRRGRAEPLAGQLDRLVKMLAGQKGRRLAFIDYIGQKGTGAVQAQALGIGQFALDQRLVIVAPKSNVMGRTAGRIVEATEVAVRLEIVHADLF